MKIRTIRRSYKRQERSNHDFEKVKTISNSCFSQSLDSIFYDWINLRIAWNESFFFHFSSDSDKSIELMGSAISSHLLLECIGHLANLARLTLHALATNIMLYSIAETCTKLQVLDISFSSEVTDLGLLYLSGGSGRCER